MKLFILITALMSFNVMAESTIKKTFDGKRRICDEKVDVGNRSYNLKIESEEIEGDKRNVVLKVLFFKCAESDSGFQVQASSADEILHNYIILPGKKLGQTDNKLVSAIISARDAKGKLLESAPVEQVEGGTIVRLSLDKDAQKVFVEAHVVTDITSPIGNLEGELQHMGGFVLNF